jgi:hypothetical protein
MADAPSSGIAIYNASGDSFCLLPEIFKALLDAFFQFASDVVGAKTQGPFGNTEFLGHRFVGLDFVVPFIDIVIQD